MTEKKNDPWKYKPSEPNKSGWLEVSKQPPHEIYWEEHGNPKGEPVIVLHGGPGYGCGAKQAQFFDPKHYRIILFDQRGAWRSKPYASLENNTTQHLIEDIEKLRDHLGVKGKAHLFGGSWGSTLALAYAIAHPDKVKSMTLRGIFLGRKKDIDVIYQGDAADRGNLNLMSPAGLAFPDDWENFLLPIEPSRRDDMVRAYNEKLTGKPVSNTYPMMMHGGANAVEVPPWPVQHEAAAAWVGWECATEHRLRADGDPDIKEYGEKPWDAIAPALIENHYFLNDECFMGKGQNYIIDNIDKIKNIPTEIVQGRYDVICPRYQADELMAAWSAVQPNEKKRPLMTVTSDGHSWGDPENIEKLTEATDRFRLLGQDKQRS